MSQKTKAFLGIAGFAALLACALLGYNALRDRVPPDAEPPLQGSQASLRQAPDFTVTDEQGNTCRLSDFRGRPVVLNFWASWCPPCRQEMPEFDKVHGELGGEVAFLMVDTLWSGETVSDGANFVQDQGYGFPVYFDTKNQAAAAYGMSGIPATFFIDAQGNIVSNARGAISEAELRAGIEGIR